MKIIVPMAGRGSRLRPHTLTVPKPLVPVAGKPIVHRLVEDIAKILDEEIEEIAFILGDPAFFGDDVVASLKELAISLGAKPSIYRQLDPKEPDTQLCVPKNRFQDQQLWLMPIRLSALRST